MQRINTRKMLVRMIEALIFLEIIILTPISIVYTNKLRGYHAFGGEYFILILRLLIILIIDTIFEENEK